MAVLKFQSVKSIIGKVFRDLKIQDAHWVGDAVEWCGEALQAIGSISQLERKVEITKASSHKAIMPTDLYLIDEVRYGHGNSEKAESSPPKLEDFSHIMPYASTGIHPSLVDQYNTRSSAGSYSDESFFINGNAINTSFERDWIAIVYKGVATDEEGYPKVPDHYSFNQALYWYVVMKLLEGGMEHPAGNNQINWAVAEDRWKEYCVQARTKALMPDASQYREFMKSWVSLIPNIEQGSIVGGAGDSNILTSSSGGGGAYIVDPDDYSPIGGGTTTPDPVPAATETRVIESGPELSSTLLTFSNITENQADVSFTKATPGLRLTQEKKEDEPESEWTTISTQPTELSASDYVYELYSGDIADLNDEDFIRGEVAESSGIDVNTLVADGNPGETLNVNILVRDYLGNTKVYAANSLSLDDTFPFTEVPILLSKNESTDNVVLNFADEPGLTIEYEQDGSWINVGDVTQVTISSLPESSSFNYLFRYRNVDGFGASTIISFSTTQAAPNVAPTLSVGSITNDGATINRTSVSGATDYESEINNSGAWDSIGLVASYSITGRTQNTVFTNKLRARNGSGPGPESNELTILTRTNEAPGISLVSKTDTTITINVAPISGQPMVSYFARIDFGAWINVGLGEHTFTGLDPSGSYAVEFRADNASGEGQNIGIEYYTTDPAIGTPTFDNANFVNGVNEQTNKFFITGAWNALAGAIGYRVQLSNGTIQDVGNVTSYQFVDLEQANDYIYKLQAYSGTSQSVWIQIPVQTDDSVLIETTESGQFTI